MAGFHTHIAVSTAVGMGYAMWGSTQYEISASTCVLAGGLCSIAGIMPDLDSDSGIPARETISLAAAIVPMLLFQRFHGLGMSVEHMVLAGTPLYLVIRFGFGSILKSVSIHRGMFHSIPAAIIAGLIGYLICDSGVSLVRYYKAFAVTLGYMIHLLLDEIWSLEFGAGLPRIKKSFGTALKLFGDDPGPNLSTYCILGLLTLFAMNDQIPSVQILPLASRSRTDSSAPLRHSPQLSHRPTGSWPDEDIYGNTAREHGVPDNGWQRPRAVRHPRMDDPWR
ncbi:MAG: metal-dependent hydrolase [Planctomycetales bacterium]|nr:metal-dependent hydrolase [Planctomycetales bacterium]